MKLLPGPQVSVLGTVVSLPGSLLLNTRNSTVMK